MEKTDKKDKQIDQFMTAIRGLIGGQVSLEKSPLSFGSKSINLQTQPAQHSTEEEKNQSFIEDYTKDQYQLDGTLLGGSGQQ